MLAPQPRPLTDRTATTPHPLARVGGLWRDLEHPRLAFSAVTPNWFAAVMGTGIVAVAAASLPVQPWGLRGAATVVWAVAALLLVVLVVATVVHWALFPTVARSHALHPVVAHFYGAVPMALLTVGAGTNLLGRDVLGARLAVDLDRGLWTLGTLLGLGTAVAVPYLMFTRHTVSPADAFGGWLMPVVPPMVSASTGALLLPTTPAGQPRLTLLLACYAMFGVSLVASLVIIALVWQRLAVHGVGPARMVPTLWIVLGPLGQSVTAANLLGSAAPGVVGGPDGTALRAFGLVYGVPVWGFALLWAGVAAAITVRTARDRPSSDGHPCAGAGSPDAGPAGGAGPGAAARSSEGLPFSLTWWSFTFPVGTVVTGTSALAAHTGADALRWAAVVGYVALLVAWATVATRTLRGAWRGRLLLG